MKTLIMLTVLFASTLCFAQAPETKGEILLGPSIPGTLGFIITGEPARLIYEKLSAAENDDPHFGPGNVKEKVAEGITCRLSIKKEIGHWCEITITANGVLTF